MHSNCNELQDESRFAFQYKRWQRKKLPTWIHHSCQIWRRSNSDEIKILLWNITGKISYFMGTVNKRPRSYDYSPISNVNRHGFKLSNTDNIVKNYTMYLCRKKYKTMNLNRTPTHHATASILSHCYWPVHCDFSTSAERAHIISLWYNQYIKGDGCTSWSTQSFASIQCPQRGSFVIRIYNTIMSDIKSRYTRFLQNIADVRYTRKQRQNIPW